jgi:hypothetical protein
VSTGTSRNTRRYIVIAAASVIVVLRPFAAPRPYSYEVSNEGNTAIAVQGILGESISKVVTIEPGATRRVTVWRRSGSDSAMDLILVGGTSAGSCGYQSGLVPQAYRVALDQERKLSRCSLSGPDFLAVFPGV